MRFSGLKIWPGLKNSPIAFVPSIGRACSHRVARGFAISESLPVGEHLRPRLAHRNVVVDREIDRLQLRRVNFMSLPAASATAGRLNTGEFQPRALTASAIAVMRSCALTRSASATARHEM